MEPVGKWVGVFIPHHLGLVSVYILELFKTFFLIFCRLLECNVRVLILYVCNYLLMV